jgi:hypothetical protein
MAAMSEKFMRAAAMGNSVDGLLKTLPPEGQELLGKIGSAVISQLAPVKPDGNGASHAPPSPAAADVKPPVTVAEAKPVMKAPRV